MNTQNTQECKVKPTTGPWSVFGCTVYQDDCWNAGRNDGGTRICSTYSGSPEEERDEVPTDQQHVNARLIAAAPELLEACKIARAHLGFGDCTLDNVRRICDEAITKAEAQ